MTALERLEDAVAAFLQVHDRSKYYREEDKRPVAGGEDALYAWSLRAEAREEADTLAAAWADYQHRAFCDEVLAASARIAASQATPAHQAQVA